MSIINPKRPIGWEMVDDTHFRVTQVGFEPEECVIGIQGYADPVPDGYGKIGSVVVAAYSREAAIYDQEDDGTSKLA